MEDSIADIREFVLAALEPEEHGYVSQDKYDTILDGTAEYIEEARYYREQTRQAVEYVKELQQQILRMEKWLEDNEKQLDEYEKRIVGLESLIESILQGEIESGSPQEAKAPGLGKA